MTWEDWIIVLILAAGVIGGLKQGFFRSICGFGGSLLALVLAAWNYKQAAALLKRYIPVEAVANVVGFLLVAVLVMITADLTGKLLSKAFHSVGLGFADRLAGGAFGFLKSFFVVNLVILVTVAFFPATRWLNEGRMPKLFFGACHLSSHMSPAELGDRVRSGLKLLEDETPRWMHSGVSQS